MSTVEGGNRILTDGLVFYVDGANNRSYISGSTSWNDLTPKLNVVTLFSGVTYTTSNGGSLVFDGIDDYGTIPYTSDFDLSGGNYTLEGWFNSNSFSLPQSLISKDTWGINFDWAKKEVDVINLNHYTNLQPLCSKINRDLK